MDFGSHAEKKGRYSTEGGCRGGIAGVEGNRVKTHRLLTVFGRLQVLSSEHGEGGKNTYGRITSF